MILATYKKIAVIIYQNCRFLFTYSRNVHRYIITYATDQKNREGIYFLCISTDIKKTETETDDAIFTIYTLLFGFFSFFYLFFILFFCNFFYHFFSFYVYGQLKRYAYKRMITHYWRTNYNALICYKRVYVSILSIGIYQN